MRLPRFARIRQVRARTAGGGEAEQLPDWGA